MSDRYGRDVLASDPHPGRPEVAEIAADPGVVVEDAETGWCGAVCGLERGPGGWLVVLEDRRGARRSFPLGPGFWIDGAPVRLVRPRPRAAAGPRLTASGSIAVEGARARVALPSRILVEGRHDAELVERVWGEDLRVEGVVVEELAGVDNLPDVIREHRPGVGRRLGVLVDHLVAGSKESAVAAQARQLGGGHVLVVGHPYVDVWAAIKPARVGLAAWPDIPRGIPWKKGTLQALGWPADDVADEARGWARILATVRGYTDLEPALSGRVEELIDFVTSPAVT